MLERERSRKEREGGEREGGERKKRNRKEEKDMNSAPSLARTTSKMRC